jgi:phytanoyl-CoA hydroxylase
MRTRFKSKKEYKDFYEENGYVVFEGLIPEKSIDKILIALEKFKKRRLPYYSQSIHNWIKPKIDSNGFMTESMENPTRLLLNGGLGKASKKILLGKEINEALKTINPRFDNFVQWNNMLFDKSVGTMEHVDSFFLDTLPSGYLCAAWVALENIDKNSGPFRVYPCSHKLFLQDKFQGQSLEDHFEKCQELTKSAPFELALLKKGDVLFWHPSLIHGALDQIDEKFSRKSLTSHYYPLGVSKRGSENKIIHRPSHLKQIYNFLFRQPPKRFNDYEIYIDVFKVDCARWYFNGMIKLLKNKFKRNTYAKDDIRRKSYNK